MSKAEEIIKKCGYRRFLGMIWPAPSEKLSAVIWRLKYGQPSKMDLHYAASVMGAYVQMVGDPRSKRQEVIAQLRKGPGIEEANEILRNPKV